MAAFRVLKIDCSYNFKYDDFSNDILVRTDSVRIELQHHSLHAPSQSQLDGESV